MLEVVNGAHDNVGAVLLSCSVLLYVIMVIL
jgi:hypothetical protein